MVCALQSLIPSSPYLSYYPHALHPRNDCLYFQVLTGILRHYATVLLASTPKAQDQRTIREQRSLAHGIHVRQHFHVLSERSFNARRDVLTAAYESGAYLKAPENKGQAPPNPMTDPNAMEGMMGAMKGQMAMIIPNTLIMSWINAFFSGYVISMFVSYHASWAWGKVFVICLGDVVC